MGRSRSRSRSRSKKGKSKSKSRDRRHDSDSEEFVEKKKPSTFQLRGDMTIEQQIILGKIERPPKPKVVPNPPKPKQLSQKELEDIIAKKRTVIKEKHDTIYFAARKDIPENIVQFSQGRYVVDGLGMSLLIGVILKMFKLYSLKLKADDKGLDNISKVDEKLRTRQVLPEEDDLRLSPFHLITQQTLTEFEALKQLAAARSDADLLRTGVSAKYHQKELRPAPLVPDHLYSLLARPK